MTLKNKKIVIFIWQDWLHPRAGGAEYYCRCLSKILVKQGAQVTIVACLANPSESRLVTAGITIERIAPRALIVPATAIWYLKHRREIDLVIDFTNKIPYLTPLYVRRPLIAAFMHTNGVTFQDEWGPLGYVGQTIENLLLRPYLRTPTIAISQSTKTELTGRGFNAVEVGLVPITWDQPKPSIPSNLPRIVVVSRLRKYKRLDLLIRAIASVRKKVPEIQVDIIGRGPDEQRLRQLTTDLGLGKIINFHGFVDDRQRDHLMEKAWLTTITSRKEGWGITISEAAQFAIPAIGVDAPGTRDAIIDKETGILLADDSAAVLADAIVSLIQQPELRAKLGMAAQKFAQTHTIDKLEGTWLNRIAKVLQKK